jgi:Cft2 family RNA processing exonuclease
MAWRVSAEKKGIYLPDIDWHLDAHSPVKRSFVSHAHFDHLAKHDHILCTPETSRFIQKRLPGKTEKVECPFNEKFDLGNENTAILYPAGHIAGSAQFWAQKKDGETLLYSGDFKLIPGFAAEKTTVPQADTLIMETTFGLPKYTFPTREETAKEIIKFCQKAINENATPVLFVYSLGKAQEVLTLLKKAHLPIMLHPRALEMTQIYETLGYSFPAYQKFDHDNCKGNIILMPSVSRTKPSRIFRAIKNPRVAVISGWAIDSSAIYRYGCDAVFPLSDHADYPELIEYVEKVSPKNVFTVHGYAKEFAQTLRQKGIEAWALGKENQMEFPLT